MWQYVQIHISVLRFELLEAVEHWSPSWKTCSTLGRNRSVSRVALPPLWPWPVATQAVIVSLTTRKHPPIVYMFLRWWLRWLGHLGITEKHQTTMDKRLLEQCECECVFSFPLNCPGWIPTIPNGGGVDCPSTYSSKKSEVFPLEKNVVSINVHSSEML